MSITVPEYGTIEDAAGILKCSPQTIRRLITDGTINANRIGRRMIRVDLASIQNAARPLQYVGGDQFGDIS